MVVGVVLRVVVCVMSVGLAFAQQDRGTFNGTVSDPSGAAMAGVSVTIINTATNARYHSLTKDAGQANLHLNVNPRHLGHA